MWQGMHSEESARVSVEKMRENLATNFPIEKRINIELFIGRTAALYIGETQIRVAANGDSDQSCGQWHLLIGGANVPCTECYILVSKVVGIKD